METEAEDKPKTEWGAPLHSYEIPGGLTPKQHLPVRLPKSSDYARGSTEDRLGNRGGH